ncbi:nucleotidyltransferase family protein, partial [Mesorhizobium sp. M7A.F.Ca.CA.001.05.1.1]
TALRLLEEGVASEQRQTAMLVGGAHPHVPVVPGEGA